MSYTELFSVPEKGEMVSVAEFRNAHRGAPFIWDAMAKKYIEMGENDYVFSKNVTDKLWKLPKDSRLEWYEKVTLLSTWDSVMVRKENIPRLVEAFKLFVNRYGEGSLLEQCDEIMKLIADKETYAICWIQTSVASDVWDVKEDDTCSKCDRDSGEWVKHDISKNEGHFFLFEEAPQLLGKVVV